MHTIVAHVQHAALLAVSPSPSPSPKVKEPDPDTVSPGLIGLLFLVLLAVATFLLARSLIKQLKKVDFDEDAATAAMKGEAVPVASVLGADDVAPSAPPADDADLATGDGVVQPPGASTTDT